MVNQNTQPSPKSEGLCFFSVLKIYKKDYFL